MAARSHVRAADVAEAITLFFAVRRIIRTKLGEGRRLDPATWLHIETLKFIAEHGEPKMKDIAAYLSITAPSATSLVNGLAKSGLVSYVADPRDRRTSRVALTAKGKAALKSAVTRGSKILKGLFDTLTDAELSAFTLALKCVKRAAK